MDGPLYKIGTEIADVMILTFFWILGCIPIITIATSTSAVFYVYGKKVRGEDVYISKDFAKSFKQNFKQSIPITLILIILWVSVSSYLLMVWAYGGKVPLYLSAAAIFFALEVSLLTVYVLGILSRFYMKLATIFVTAFMLAHRHIGSSLLMIISSFVIVIACLNIPLLLVFVPVLTIATNSFFLQKIFAKHVQAVEHLNQEIPSESEDEVDINEDSNQDINEENSNEEDPDKDFLKYI